MKFLHVITTADPKLGGPIEGVRQRAQVLQKWGHEVELVTVDDPNADYLSKFPFPIHAMGPSKTSLCYSDKLIPWFREHLKDYDVVIVNGIWQYPNIALHKAATAQKKKYWVFTHGMLDPYFNRAYPMKKLKKQLIWPWQHPVLRDAESVLFTCEDEKLLARESFSPYKVREHVVSYGTARPPEDTDGRQREAFLEKFPQLRGKRYLLFLSRIHPKKGADILLEAFGKVGALDPDLYLVMAGPASEEYLALLQKVASDANVADRVIWTGMVSGDVKYGAFRGAEAFILPSHQENFGIAVVEALACGVPVLISKQVNIWREIEADGAALTETDDLAGTEKLLKKWIETPPEKRAAMAAAAGPCYDARYTVEGSARSLIEATQAA